MKTEVNALLLKTLSVVTEEEQSLLNGGFLHMSDYGRQNQFDSRKLLPEQQVITVRPHTRFAEFPMHTHNYVELLWQIRGHTVHTLGNGEKIDLKAGELLLFGIGAKHAVRRAGAEDIAVNFIVLPHFFDVALEMIGDGHALGRFLIDTLREQTPDISCFHFQVSEVAPIQLLLESMTMGLIEPKYSSRRIDQTTMGLLFLHLLRHTQSLAMPESKSGHILVVDALREIEENYQNANFAAIAEKWGVSPAYLSRVVKESTGHSCTELLQERRMKQAAELLRRTGLTVVEISEAVGYNNTSYFYRLFRRRWGCGPAEYRSRV